MKKLTTCLFLILTVIVANAQIKKPKFDVNTIFVCIDAKTYDMLFDNPIIKDIFIAKNAGTKTTNDDYQGKYLIGESATIEFFKPKPTKLFGDELSDIGIEFKTRKIGQLSHFIEIVKDKAIKTDSTFTESDGKKQAWYSSAERKTNNLAFSLLEYDKTYLQDLGFTETEINTEMTYADFNKKISGGWAYPKKFISLSSVTIIANPVDIKEVVKTFEMFGLKKMGGKSYASQGFVIKTIVDKREKKIQLSKIGIKLNEPMPTKNYQIGESIKLITHHKSAEIIFLNPLLK